MGWGQIMEGLEARERCLDLIKQRALAPACLCLEDSLQAIEHSAARGEHAEVPPRGRGKGFGF